MEAGGDSVPTKDESRRGRRWSMEAPTLNETLGQLQRRNPRFAVEAYVFVLGGLHRRLAELDRPRHISGAELAGAVRDLAIDRFGLLARVVLEHWGVHSTEDIGEIVFLLVDHGVLAKQETDRREDFADVFSFEEVFELEYPWGAPGR
jgi:uncharacterized repeat protein (TIGR04138 family)